MIEKRAGKRHLEKVTQRRFGKPLRAFLKEMIEDRCLYNYQVAEMLHTKRAKIGALCREFGLSRRNGFKKRFEEKYGPGSVEAFQRLSARPDTTLRDIARRFGFSRQYAWVVYEKICGTPYSTAFQEKRRLRRNEKQRKERAKRLRSKKLLGFRQMEKELKVRGTPARLVRQGKSYRLVTEQGILNLKYTERPVTIGKKQYFNFLNAGCTETDCDFCICRCKDLERSIHYIIPTDVMPARAISLPPQAQSEIGGEENDSTCRQGTRDVVVHEIQGSVAIQRGRTDQF